MNNMRKQYDEEYHRALQDEYIVHVMQNEYLFQFWSTLIMIWFVGAVNRSTGLGIPTVI